MEAGTRRPLRAIETARLRLWPLAEKDVPELHVLCSEPKVRRYLFDGESPSRESVDWIVRESMRALHERGLPLCGLHLPGDARLAGFCGLRPEPETDEVELLYALAPAWFGRGFATEAARACLRFGFEECEAPRIVAGTDAPNAASLAVIARLGMRAAWTRPGAFGDVRSFTLERTELQVGSEPYALRWGKV
jgi:ribosomal-protein-alanine N-acetyltransferase